MEATKLWWDPNLVVLINGRAHLNGSISRERVEEKCWLHIVIAWVFTRPTERSKYITMYAYMSRDTPREEVPRYNS